MSRTLALILCIYVCAMLLGACTDSGAKASESMKFKFNPEEAREYSLSFFYERTFPKKEKLIEFWMQMDVRTLEKDENGNTRLKFTFQPQKLFCLFEEVIHEYDMSAPPDVYSEEARSFMAFAGLTVETVVSSDGIIISSDWRNLNLPEFLMPHTAQITQFVLSNYLNDSYLFGLYYPTGYDSIRVGALWSDPSKPATHYPMPEQWQLLQQKDSKAIIWLENHEFDFGSYYLITQNLDTTGTSAYDFKTSGQVTVSLEDGWPISVVMAQITDAKIGTDKSTAEGQIKVSASSATRLELISVNGKPYKK